MSLTVAYAASARKDLKRLDPRVAARVTTAIERLAANNQGDVKRLTDVRPPEYRLRVGDVRVIFELETSAETLTVLHVLPRGAAYR